MENGGVMGMYNADFCKNCKLIAETRNKLSNLLIEQAALEKHLILEDNKIDQMILKWKIENIKKQISWFENVMK